LGTNLFPFFATQLRVMVAVLASEGLERILKEEVVV
jgi:hypothetical protein